METFVFTCGDINGIGPEIALKAIKKVYRPSQYKLLFLCPAKVFSDTHSKLNFNLNFEILNEYETSCKGGKNLTVLDLGKAKQSYGQPAKISGSISYKAITTAIDLTLQRAADAIITAPISKKAFNLAGIDFPGHTELLAERTGAKNFMMMFLSENFKAALYSIHIPVRDIPASLTKFKLTKKLDVVVDTMIRDFGIQNPRIAVLGLNPHAGESGLIGDEEKRIITPVVRNYDRVEIDGPLVPDAFFGNKLYLNYDVVLGIYHDQVLIPFKMLNFNNGVNYTAGLPIIRTSPDHGTAYDIAGEFKADPTSMINAFKYARQISQTRNALGK